MTQRAAHNHSFSAELNLAGFCEAYEIDIVEVLHKSWKKNTILWMMIILTISPRAYLRNTLAVAQTWCKNSFWCVCNLNKNQFHYPVECIQLSIIMHFILSVTSLTQFFFSRTSLQLEEMGSYLGVIFNGVTFLLCSLMLMKLHLRNPA